MPFKIKINKKFSEGMDDATPIMGKVDTRPRIDISNQLEKEKAAKQLAKELEKFISDFDTTLGFAEFQAIKSVSGSNLRILSNLNAAIQEINNLKTLESEADPEFFLFEIEKIFNLEKWKNRKLSMSEAYGETEEDIESQKQKLLVTIPDLIEKAEFLSNFVRDDIDARISAPSLPKDIKRNEANPFKRIISSLKAVELGIKDSQNLKLYGKKLQERNKSMKIGIEKLKRIIQEESHQFLKEAGPDVEDSQEYVKDAIVRYGTGCKPTWKIEEPGMKIFFDITGFTDKEQTPFGQIIIAGEELVKRGGLFQVIKQVIDAEADPEAVEKFKNMASLLEEATLEEQLDILEESGLLDEGLFDAVKDKVFNFIKQGPGAKLYGKFYAAFKTSTVAANHVGFIFSDGTIFHSTSDEVGVQFANYKSTIDGNPQMHFVINIGGDEGKLRATCQETLNRVKALKAKDAAAAEPKKTSEAPPSAPVPQTTNEESTYNMAGIAKQAKGKAVRAAKATFGGSLVGGFLDKLDKRIQSAKTKEYEFYCSELVANVLVRVGMLSEAELEAVAASRAVTQEEEADSPKISRVELGEVSPTELYNLVSRKGEPVALACPNTTIDSAAKQLIAKSVAGKGKKAAAALSQKPAQQAVSQQPVQTEQRKRGITTYSFLTKIIEESLQEHLIFEEELGHDTAILENGTPVCEACLYETMTCGCPDTLEEAKYQGRSVPLGKPMRGDVKKFKVYVRDPSTGNIKKVNFGDPNMKIKKSNPARRKSFRARHNCDNPGPRTKARYWSCRKW